jgi:prepilin-type N-terminal cleavage/methylation domain-containing protein
MLNNCSATPNFRRSTQVRLRAAFTLIEVIIVILVMAVLAAVIIPQFTASTTDAKLSSLKFNLHTLRAQLELYRNHHEGNPPSATLIEMLKETDAKGNIGAGANFPYGPYMDKIPANPFTASSTVTPISSSPATPSDVTGSGGWLFNATTGEIWADDADHVVE